MAKLKDIPFGSEIPTFDNDGYITLSSGLRNSSGIAIISMDCSGSAYFDGAAYCACYASYASEAGSANRAYEACRASYADSAGNASYACSASEAGNAFYACCASIADCASYTSYACYASEACCACEACCAGLAGEAYYLNYSGSLFVPSYCNSLSAYLLGVCQ